MTPAVEVGGLAPGDAAAVEALLSDLPHVYPGADVWLARTLRETAAGGASCSIARVGGKMAGVLIDKPKPEGRRKLSTLYVDRWARGRGAARALLDEAMRRWWAEGVAEAYVTCRVPRDDALIECLSSRGFAAGPLLPGRYGTGRDEQVLSWRPRRRTAVFSLWKAYADAIWSGEKRYEFRRRRMSVAPGDRVLVYETAPASAVVGEFIAGALVWGTPAQVRAAVGAAGGPGLDEYFAGAEMVSGVRVVAPLRYARPRPLSDFGLVRPPLSYAFLR